MEAVLRKVLKTITPSDGERRELSHVLKRILNAADDVIKPLKLEKTIAGSFIRDTWLSDKKEIDLFIMFPVSYSRGDLEKLGLEVGRKIVRKLGGEYEIAYAEHPYVRGKVNGFAVDIVPCYKVKSASKIKSAVDRTPFHNRYISGNFKPRTSKEVRLLKQFCKAIDVYGSDVRTLGFSGYLCELLIIKYKTFKNLVRSAGSWKFGKFIDLEGHCSIRRGHFRDQPLIVIDPTDPKRNVAAALSNENFTKFVETCRKFSGKPSGRFFKIDKKVIKTSEFRKLLKGRGSELFVLKFRRPRVVDDILWSQMRRTVARIIGLSKDNEFEVFSHSEWSDQNHSYLIFEMSAWKLPAIQKLTGPPVYSKKHSKDFEGKYKKDKAYIEGEKWVAEVKRKYRDFETLLRDFLDRPEKKLLKEGVRSHIARSVSRGFKILKSGDIGKLIGKDKEFAVFLRKYFERGI
ncbi:MAG: CCA tRNA nucleotidyltransferase [Candidatus Aenigmatarchaeota archaeon]|nr:MAG: CCA tRNA nucleotidyltransferase [Candidatus Aenigmarchaeota archaeon]